MSSAQGTGTWGRVKATPAFCWLWATAILKAPGDNKYNWRQKLGQDTSQRNHFYLQVKHAAKRNPHNDCKGEKLQIKLSSSLVWRAGADRGARAPMHPTTFPLTSQNHAALTASNQVSQRGCKGHSEKSCQVWEVLFIALIQNLASKIMSGLEAWPRRKANAIIKPLTHSVSKHLQRSKGRSSENNLWKLKERVCRGEAAHKGAACDNYCCQ